MAVQAGTRLGVYEVTDSIGAGGMGQVYRARDTKLERDVAVKVLPEAFADAPDRLARFEREAKLLASLNHPYIAAIYGLEEADAVRFIVLELVPGDTLFDRLHKGPIPLDETLRLAKQIAEALEAAHAKGVIHRDLKPANVKITPDGQVKVLDFGLAKAFDEETVDGDASNSPTLSAASTKAGMILGTAAYMSPEQARGISVDKRSDIFSFGSLLFEMLTGRKTFPGELVSDTLASVIKSDPDWNGLPPSVPPRLRELLRRCLEKDPNKRRRDIGDVRVEVEEIMAGKGGPVADVAASSAAAPLWRRALPVALALIIGTVFGVAVSRRPTPDAPVLRYSIPLPEDVRFTNTGRHLVAISPDGKRLAHTGNHQLFVREMHEMEAVPVRGTSGGAVDAARSPFFSPDGEWIGFWAENELRKVAVRGGAPITLCAAQNPYGASWSDDDTIVYGQGPDGIWEVSSNGGKPVRLVELADGERAHGPQLLPGGDALLFTLGASSIWDESSAVIHSLSTGERRVLIEGASDARYLASGHIVYALADALFAVPFDIATLSLTGGPVSILEGVQRAIGSTAAAHFSVSDSGTLVYVPGAAGVDAELVWVDPDGSQASLTGTRADYGWPRFSPDGRRLAVEIRGGDGRDVWILDLERDTASRLTVGGRSESPIWSPDGEWVAFRSSRGGEAYRNIYRRRADFSGEAERLLEGDDDLYLYDWSRDGWLLYNARDVDRVWNLWAWNVERSDEPRPIVRSPFLDTEAGFSPDRNWVVFLSNASGRFEVYVTPFPDSGRRYQISTSGGTDPVWSPDGDRIYYMSESRATLVAVDVETEPEFRAGSPRELFDVNVRLTVDRDYDVAPDGERFAAIVTGAGADAQSEIDVITNWFQELKERVPIE